MSLIRCNGLVVIALDSRSGSLGWSLGQGHCVVFIVRRAGGRGGGVWHGSGMEKIEDNGSRI